MSNVKFPEMTGRMKQLYDYVIETSPIERPVLSMASVIATFGTLYSNLYRFNSTYPVFYLMLIARSGSGKNRPLKVAKTIFAASELREYIGQAGYRSDVAVIEGLEDQRHRLDMLDEVDGVFKISKSDNGFLSGIINMLTELWSDCNSYFPGRRTKTDGLAGNCWNPCINIICALTPTAFRENFTRSMMLTGFGARFLYFVANEETILKDRYIGKANKPVPNELIEYFKTCGEMKEAGYDEEKSRYRSLNLPITSEAADLLESIRKKWFYLGQEMAESEPLAPLVQRMYENLERLLIIHTVSNAEDKLPTIEVINVEWCRDFIWAMFESSRKFLSENVVDGQFEILKGKILRPIKESTPNGVGHSKLLKNSHLSADQFKRVIDTLTECKLITKVEKKGAKFYHYIGRE